MRQGKSFEDMEIKVVEDHQESTKEEIENPLLEEVDKDFPDVERTIWIEKAISQISVGTIHTLDDRAN
ncbi:hypothetical protein Bca4012_014264 [Brassica carinata]